MALKSLKSLLFESDAEPKPEKATSPAPSPSPTTVPTTPMTLSEAYNFYEKLLEKTKFDATQSGGVIAKYATTLAAIPDQTLRMKTAVAQAKSLDKVTDDEIKDAFEHMKDSLVSERVSFDDAMLAFEKSEVTVPKARVAEILQQIQDLSTERNKLEERISTGQGQLARSRSDFENAVNRRTAEITQEQTAVLSAL